jgi:DNA-binding beta-propeller fold protein YncE
LTVAVLDSDVARAGSVAITVANPEPAQAPSTALTYSVHPAGRHNLAMDVGDVIWDPVRGVLYASVLDTDLNYPNRVVALDPMSGEVLRSIVVGSNPKRLAIADDASVLYVALDGAGAIRPIDLVTFTARPPFPVGLYRSEKILYANDIEVMPGHPETIAVTLLVHGDWTGEGPIAEVMIFDDGVARALSTWSGNMIEFTAPDTLYGVGEGGYARIGVIQMVVTDSGAVWARSVSDLPGGDGGDFDYVNGSFFTAGGGVIDVPQITARGPVAVYGNVGGDASTGRVFYMTDTTLSVIDGSTLQLVGTEVVHGMPPIGQSYYAPKPLIRWGVDGVAYRTYGHLVILRTSLAVP